MMTGAQLCRRCLEDAGIAGTIVAGAANAYVHGERLIVLRAHVFRGTSREHLTLAAHEAGHALQEHAFGWAAPALRWLMPGRLWLEWDASRRARRLLRSWGIEPQESMLRASWRAYVASALWQGGALVAVWWVAAGRK